MATNDEIRAKGWLADEMYFGMKLQPETANLHDPFMRRTASLVADDILAGRPTRWKTEVDESIKATVERIRTDVIARFPL